MYIGNEFVSQKSVKSNSFKEIDAATTFNMPAGYLIFVHTVLSVKLKQMIKMALTSSANAAMELLANSVTLKVEASI